MAGGRLKATISKAIEARVREYLDVAGESVTAYLQKKLSRPAIQNVDGELIASMPGEFPRKRTGSLQESIDYSVYKRGENLYLKFGALQDTMLNGKTSRPTLYAVILEHRRSRLLTRAAWSLAKRNGVLRRGLKQHGGMIPGTGKFVKIPGNPGRLKTRSNLVKVGDVRTPSEPVDGTNYPS